ncbi:uncharacterized protein LOC133527293 [Cydia pomonella]|uniref:uncharacterized protein LOC133527293 n=1 Tax=Cydia pomonella TaxID=82600 RepID=UPI002ADDE3CD|nr:uncharacterized protein LOC133527293 [Cydia pomonella]XP_061720253.1 uncharacterized protein LOC133527293 [Cydia pomonella]
MDELLSRTKTSVGVVSLRWVLRLRLAVGFYPHLSTRAVLRAAARLYCIVLSTTVITIYFSFFVEDRSLRKYFDLVYIINYAVCVYISLLTGEKDLFNFCKMIEQVDRKLGFPHLPLLTFRAKIMFLCIYLYETVKLIAFVFAIPRLDWKFFTICIISIATSVHCIIQIIFLDLLRSRLALLRQVFELNLKLDINSSTIMDSQIQNISECLKLYAILIDTLSENFFWSKLQIIIRFTTCFAFCITKGAECVSRIKHAETLTGLFDQPLVLETTNCFIRFILASLPAVFTELIHWEEEKLKTVIANQLLDCEDCQYSSDDSLYAALTLAADYIQHRPFRLSLWNLLPLDASLVLTFAGFCTTYLIVVTQIFGII